MTTSQLLFSINGLIRQAGVPTGSRVRVGLDDIGIGVDYNDYSGIFEATIPAAFHAVAVRIFDLFRDSGLITDVGSWEHLGAEGADLIHILGIIP